MSPAGRPGCAGLCAIPEEEVAVMPSLGNFIPSRCVAGRSHTAHTLRTTVPRRASRRGKQCGEDFIRAFRKARRLTKLLLKTANEAPDDDSAKEEQKRAAKLAGLPRILQL
eukprot:TRINITY_DN76418_c0_g1_i1.p1 TRINITY_DN76418_c0_g1~~TRINITY_DN76418_c0_g1_i1.p1  ORF type:complete len:111 (+),score=14.28 TRINITY_DN76418_c0_g1_i1:113-445(+)